MTDNDLVAALRWLKINTKSIACLGFPCDDRCSTKGCRLMGAAADRLEKYAAAIETIKAMHTAASGVGKLLLRDVLSLFDNSPNPAPEPPRVVCDFERCGVHNLAATILEINNRGFRIFAITQNGCDYTVFFHRPNPLE